MNKADYPPNWREVSRAIRERAGHSCECIGECGAAHEYGRCNAMHNDVILRSERAPWLWTSHNPCTLCVGGDPSHKPVRVILTVAHLDHDSSHADPARLKAMCQRCHLVLDRHQHASSAKRTRMARKAVAELPGLEAPHG